MNPSRAVDCTGSHRVALMGVAALSVAALSSCATLTDIQAEQCGNGVVESEVNEDCDLYPDEALGPDTACGQPAGPVQQRCRYICVGEDGIRCPVGWACDRSGVCQFASGEFDEAQGSPVQLLSETLQLGDVDGDRNLDLIGFSETEAQLRFGNGAGQFLNQFFFTTPAQSGPALFGQLDDEANYDALFPFEFGLVVLRGQSAQDMIPVPSVAELGDAGMPFPPQARAQQLQLTSGNGIPLSRALVFITDAPDTQPTQLHASTRDIATPPVLFPSRLPIRTLDNILPIPTADVDFTSPLDGGDMVVAFTGDDRFFVVGVTGANPDSLQLTMRAEVVLPPGTTVSDEVLMVNVNGDGTIDVMIEVIDGGGEERVVVALSQGDGTFLPAAVDDRFDQLRADCLADALRGIGEPDACKRFPVGAGNLGGNLLADYVGANAIYLSTSTVGPFTRATDRFSVEPWTEAVVADFNGDGDPDVAAVSNDAIGADFMMGNSSGFFTPVRLTTAGEPFSLRVGDFDGDFISDLAFAESLNTEDAISVIFGEPAGPPVGAVTMGRFNAVNYCEVGRAPVTNDLVDELTVDTSTGDQVSLSQFFGTSQRRMVSPFTFDPAGGRAPVNVVLFGRFGGQGSSDVMALIDARADPNDAARRPRFFILDDVSSGANPELSDEVPVMGAMMGSLQQFRLDCALWAAGDIDNDGVDEIVAIDQTDACRRGPMMPGTPRLLILDLVGTGDNRALVPMVAALPGGLTVPRELALIDLDPPDPTADPAAVGDGLDLVVTFAGDQVAADGCTSGGNSGVIVYWGVDGDERTVVSGLSSSAIPSTAAANLDSDIAMELAIWTADGVYVADPGADRGLAAVLTKIETSAVCDGRIAAGDFDRDNIADLAVSDGSAVDIFLSIPHTQDDVDNTIIDPMMPGM